MPTCKDCKNYRSRDEIDGYCMASDDVLVESDRDSEDCLGNCFQSKKPEE